MLYFAVGRRDAGAVIVKANASTAGPTKQWAHGSKCLEKEGISLEALQTADSPGF